MNKPPQLTPRELQVAQGVWRDLRNKEIAVALGIAEFTAANHLKTIFRKLGLRSRVQLAVWVERQAAGHS